MIVRTDSQKVLVRAAFTLMEVLVVVAIIVALASVGGYYAFQQYQNSLVRRAIIGAEEITQAIENYKLDHKGMLPDNFDPSVLLMPDEYGGPWLKKQSALTDPWGNPYQVEYEADGVGPENRTYGNYQPDVYTIYNGRKIGNWNVN